MATHRSALIKLAHANPELRTEILSLLASGKTAGRPSAAVRLASLTVKLANKPMLERAGLNSRAAAEGMGSMLYFIDSAKNHSKFYEMLIVPTDGGYMLKKTWGALTDNGDTGRSDKKDQFFMSLRDAQKELSKTYNSKVGKGYKDAYSRMMHKSPTTGETLPMGQYPVGLVRTVGFGWGTQSATKCIPSLASLRDTLDSAIQDLSEEKDLTDLLADLQAADRLITGLMRNPDAVDATNQSMGDLLAKALSTPMNRIMAIQGASRSSVGRPVMLDRGKLRKELVAIRNYVGKQISHCA